MNARLAVEHVIMTAAAFDVPIRADAKERERIIARLETNPDMIGPFLLIGQQIARGQLTAAQAIRFYDL